MSALRDLLNFAKRRARLTAAYEQTYRSPHGKIVLEDLLRKSGLLEVSPPEDARFYDGRRSMGLEILSAMRWTEGELVALAQEQTAGDLAERQMEEA